MPDTAPRATLGTKSAAMMALALVSPPQPATLAEDHRPIVVPAQPTSSCVEVWNSMLQLSEPATTAPAGVFQIREPALTLDVERVTTLREEAIGELRSWALLPANWDSEKAAAPDAASLKEAERFVRLLKVDQPVPEPMLLASGRAGLYWNDGDLYADLEFTGDGHVTYYVERRRNGKHKGMVAFDGSAMPSVFAALLPV